MPYQPYAIRRLLCAGATFLSFSALAIPDHITVPATNPWTGQAVTFSLDKYNLRATNYQVRVYSMPSTYTTLSAAQLPEVTTFRGGILEDPGAHVLAGIRPDGVMFYDVSYGCRDTGRTYPAGLSYYSTDPYEGTNRFRWSAYQQTSYIPSLGTYVYALATNMPLPVAGPAVGTWYNQLANTNFGGPAPFNNFWSVPTLRAKVVLDATPDVVNGNYGGNLAYAILGMESGLNLVDFLHARDAGSCYQVVCVDLQTNAANPGASYDVPYNRIARRINIGGGNAQCPGTLSQTDPEDMGGAVQTHEMGHNLGQIDVITSFDYMGRTEDTSHSGSGQGHGVTEVAESLWNEAGYWQASEEWVLYRTVMPPHAMPDYVSTPLNTPSTVDVLLNDRDPNSTNRATLGVLSFESTSQQGGTVANLGGGLLRYTPPAGFRGDDLFRYYLTNAAGLKSLTGVRVLVVDPNNPLIAQYKLDETNGTGVADSSGCGKFGCFNRNSGFLSLSNISVAGVGGGRAIHFDGTFGIDFRTNNASMPTLNYWIPSPASYSYDALDQSQTISLWFQPDVTPTGAAMILYGKTELPGCGGMWIGINGTSIFATPKTYGAITALSVSAPIVPMPGTWYHLVVELDRASNLLRMWVNGVEYTSGTRAIPANEFIVGNHAAYIGSGAIIPGGYAGFQGAMQDVRIYTKALSQAEINALYAGGGLLPAGGPSPANGEQNVSVLRPLTWVPGRTNYQHDIYVGSSPDAVANATTNSPEYKGRLSAASYTPPAPWYAGSTYYWRVDEVDGGTNYATGSVWSFTAAFVVGVAQPYLKLMPSEQLAAQTPVLLDVVATSYYDPLTITNCDALSAKGGSVIITNNQLLYTPPGLFTGNDTFTYTATDVLGTNSSAPVTIYPVTEPHYIWDANGAAAGTGGSGSWDTVSFTWDDGTHTWPATGVTNFAMFQGTAGTVSIESTSVSANGLYFGTDGYYVQNNSITLTGPAPVVLVDPGYSAGINSALAGSSGLTKLGMGTLTLSGTNRYGGTTVLSQGALVLNHASALGSTTNSLMLGDSNTCGSALGLKVDSAVANPVTLASLSTTTNAASATITLNAGSALGANISAMFITNVNLSGSAPLLIQANNTGGHSTAQDITYRLAGNGIPAGTTALTLDGSVASLRASLYGGAPANNFSGDVLIKGAVTTQGYTYGPYGNIPSAQNLGFLSNNVTVASNSTWTVVWGGETCGALNGAGNISLNNQNALNNIGLTVGNNGASGTFSGTISGGFGFKKAGSGTETLSGNNTFSGGATIAAGTLSLDNAGALNSSAPNAITLGDSGAVSPTLQLNAVAMTLGALTVPAGVANATILMPQNSGTFSHTFNGATLSSPLSFNQSNAAFPNWDQITWNSKITGPGGGAGNDTLVFNNTSGMQHYITMAAGIANDFSGNVHVKSGLVAAQRANSTAFLFPSAAMLILDSSAQWRWNSGSMVETMDGLAGAGAISNPGNVTLTINANNPANNATRVFSGSLDSTAGTLTFGGAGKQTFAGAGITSANPVAVNNGTLSLSNCTALTGAITATSPGVLDLDGNWTFGKSITGSGGLSKSGTGTVTLSVSQSNTGPTTVSAGTLLLQSTIYPTNFPGLSGLTVWLDAADPNGNGSAPANGAPISNWVNKGSLGSAANFTVAGTGSAPVYTASAAAFNNKPTVTFSASGQQLANTYNFGNTLTVVYVGRIGATKQRLVSGGSVNWILGYWSGNMNVNYWNGGFIGSYSAADTNPHVWIGGATSLAVNCYRFDTVGEVLTGSGTGSSGPTAGLTLGGAWGTSEKSDGDIAELFVFNHELTATERRQVEGYLYNKWFGSPYPSILASLNNASPVSVALGATLGGVGTAGAVTVQAGATLAPGLNGIGTFTLNAAPTLSGTTVMKISKGASPSADKVVVNNQPLTYGGTLVVTNIGAIPLALGDSFTLFSATSFGGNFAVTNLPPLASGLRWDWAPAIGTLSVVTGVATNPTNITFSVSGGVLALSWPADHLGWYLQCQTNSLSVGLNNGWVTVPGSQSMTSTNIAINPAQPAVFYRLISP
jgi:autotransporter-associated beta strand protein